MSYFKAKMHQIRFRLGLHPKPRWGAHSAPTDPLADLGGPTSKGKEVRTGAGKGREKGEGQRVGRGRKGGNGEGRG